MMVAFVNGVGTFLGSAPSAKSTQIEPQVTTWLLCQFPSDRGTQGTDHLNPSTLVPGFANEGSIEYPETFKPGVLARLSVLYFACVSSLPFSIPPNVLSYRPFSIIPTLASAPHNARMPLPTEPVWKTSIKPAPTHSPKIHSNEIP